MALLLYSEAAAIGSSRQNRLGVRIAYLGWFPVNPPIAKNAMDGAPGWRIILECRNTPLLFRSTTKKRT